MAKGRIPSELLQKIKDAVNLIEIVGEHVVLRKTGANHVGLCPFHSERTPSFSVSEQKQLYHCYGCKRGGDLLSFFMEIHGMGFPEAIEELADRARIALPKDWGGASEEGAPPEVAKRRQAQREKIALAYKLNRFAAAFYHQELPKKPQSHVMKYFSSRGVNEEFSRSFYLGAAPASWDALSYHLVSKKAPLPLAVELGLIRPSQRPGSGPGYFDLFRNRAIFPILDLRGRVAGFGGRALPLPAGAPDVGGESPKYLNSGESSVFQKGKLAFGLYQAQKHIREKDEIIIVEGYFDVIALHMAGFQNVVATCGTAMTPDHFAVLHRLGSRIVLLFDGDKAGVAATERTMELGLDHGLVLYGAEMPKDLDPDEILFDQATGKAIPGGVERVQSLLTAAKPLLDARIESCIEQSGQGSEARTQALKQVAGWLGRFRDPVGREVRLQALQNKLGITRSLLDQAIRGETSRRDSAQKHTSANGAQTVVSKKKSETKPQKISDRERVLLGAFARGERLFDIISEVSSNLPPRLTFSDLFDYSPARDFVALLFQEPSVLEQFRKTPEILLRGDLDPQVRSILTEALVSTEPPMEEADIRSALNRCIARLWARFSQQIKKALADAEAKKDAGLQSQLMKEYLDVQRKMKEFSSFYDEA